MLEIKNIKKSYITGTFKQKALDGVSIKFRKNEFVAILGPSGSGKTTMLNILGGLDRYDDGDLIINNISTKMFKDRDWDAYRNNSVGFIFQSYNLIGHITILENVELSLKLSNVKKSVRKKKAIQALEKVGLKDHIHKKPNELSGGQMQRVAIARSLVNDPDIILADEPTGALDSKTSIQIMDLIKEISKDKLVIMVTHNEELASNYANRIISFKDGKVIDDTNPYKEDKENIEDYTLNKTKMSFKEALNLSINNILTKKGRTLLTAFASSIGIIGIALILSLSNGFDIQVNKYEKGIMSYMPIIVSSQSMNVDEETINSLTNKDNEFPDYDYVTRTKSEVELITRKNNITDEYKNYIETMPSEYSYGVSYYRYATLNFIVNKENPKLISSSQVSISSIPKSFDSNPNSVIETYYDLLSGSYPKNKNEMLLVVDSSNNVTNDILELLDIDEEKIDFDDIIGKKVKLVLNDDLYIYNNGMFMLNTNYKDVYDKSTIELEVVGIIRMNEDFPSYIQSSSLLYTEELIEYLISINKDSNIVKKQNDIDYNILTMQEFNEEVTKDMVISTLLGKDKVYMMLLYPKNFDTKDKLLTYLDEYNTNKSDEDKIIYTDNAEMISSMSGSVMSAITIVLVAFSSISLIVSSIMIGIITYISVLERTKEIGILRSLGARKKDISRVFNAETFIIGITSGLLGIIIALILTLPINKIIYNLTDLENVAILNPLHALILIVVSMSLTLIGGYIPSKIASKKDPVIALRTE